MKTKETESKTQRELSTLVALLCAFSFALMLANAQALRVGEAGISYKLSLWTAVAFLAGFNALFVYLELIFLYREKTSPLFRRGGLVVLILMTLGILLYPLRTLGVTRQAERFVGSGVALCFIGTGLTLVRRFVRAAEREEEEQEAQEHSAASHEPVRTAKQALSSRDHPGPSEAIGKAAFRHDDTSNHRADANHPDEPGAG
jgi:hypothetical protein